MVSKREKIKLYTNSIKSVNKILVYNENIFSQLVLTEECDLFKKGIN